MGDKKNNRKTVEDANDALNGNGTGGENNAGGEDADNPAKPANATGEKPLEVLSTLVLDPAQKLDAKTI